MHYTSHILLECIVFWCAINNGNTARNSVSPEILANFAKNVASVLSPAILGELQTRSNRSSYLVAAVPANNDANYDLNSPSTIDNIVDKTTNTASYYQPRTYPYNGLYEGDTPAGLASSQPNEGRLQGSLRYESYRRQERPNFYGSYDFSANNENFGATQKSAVNVAPSIDVSSTNQYSSYQGVGFHKAALAPEPYAGFPGFGPYGHFPGYHHGHHHRPYGGNGGDEPPPGNGGSAPEQSARQENNGTNYGGYGYGSPYFGNHGYHHPYSSFPYGGYGPNHGPFYGSYNGNGNNTSGQNGQNGYGYGPYHGGFDFYGPPGYGYGHGHSNGQGNRNGNNGNSRQTDGSADPQSNSTKNGYPRPYGPHLGTFHPHGFPSPFNLLPYDHFGVIKGGPVGGVGQVGYPIYADPFLIGFPFPYPYGPIFYGKKYLPKDKPADSGESGESREMTQAPAGGLMQNENPERISALSGEVVAPAPSSNRYNRYNKTSGRKGSKRISPANLEGRKV